MKKLTDGQVNHILSWAIGLLVLLVCGLFIQVQIEKGNSDRKAWDYFNKGAALQRKMPTWEVYMTETGALRAVKDGKVIPGELKEVKK